MANRLDVLIEKAHQFFQEYTAFYQGQLAYNQVLLQEGMKKGGFHPEVRRKIAIRDQSVNDFPYDLASELLKEMVVSQDDLQAMIGETKRFQDYDPESFSEYGAFLSELIRKVAQPGVVLELETKNREKVHEPSFYISLGNKEESSFLRGKVDALKQYYKERLLISHLGNRLPAGVKLHLQGNVGGFFAAGNAGAEIILDGECGWRPCDSIQNGMVTINGVAGHELATCAGGGKIFVNGILRSIGELYTTAFNHEIYHQGKLLPKEDVFRTAERTQN